MPVQCSVFLDVVFSRSSFGVHFWSLLQRPLCTTGSKKRHALRHSSRFVTDVCTWNILRAPCELAISPVSHHIRVPTNFVVSMTVTTYCPPQWHLADSYCNEGSSGCWSITSTNLTHKGLTWRIYVTYSSAFIFSLSCCLWKFEITHSRNLFIFHHVFI